MTGHMKWGVLRVGCEMVGASEVRNAELAIISYPSSTSGIIVLLQTPTKSR